MTFSPANFYSSPHAWLWAFAGLAAGAYCLASGFRLWRRRRRILNVPARKIRSASAGLVELSGAAAGPYTMQSPLTAAPCYYSRSIAWEFKPSGKHGRWIKVADESLHLPFFLEDNSGRVLVDPQGAEIDLRRGFQQEIPASPLSSKANLPANVASFLVRNGIGSGKKLKIQEYCVKPKDALFILGTLAANPGLKISASPSHAIPDNPIKYTFSLSPPDVEARKPRPEAPSRPAPEIVRLQGNQPPASSTRMSQQEKVAAALLKAGISTPAAWASASEPVSEAVNQDVAQGSAAGAATAAAPEPEIESLPRNVLMKGSDDTSFFISSRSPRATVQSLGWKSTLMLWGGPALSLLSLLALLQHFGW